MLQEIVIGISIVLLVLAVFVTVVRDIAKRRAPRSQYEEKPNTVVRCKHCGALQ